MKRVLVGGAVLALGIGGTGMSFAGTADGQGAQRSPLSTITTQNDHTCDSSDSDQNLNNDVTGFAILNGAGKTGAFKKIVGEVSLKDGAANDQYMVFLAKPGSGSNDGQCQLTGTLSTNAQGNGNSHIDTSKLDLDADFTTTPGQYYVVLTDATGEKFASAPVPLI